MAGFKFICVFVGISLTAIVLTTLLVQQSEINLLKVSNSNLQEQIDQLSKDSKEHTKTLESTNNSIEYIIQSLGDDRMFISILHDRVNYLNDHNYITRNRKGQVGDHNFISDGTEIYTEPGILNPLEPGIYSPLPKKGK